MSMWVDLLPIPTSRLTRCGLEPPRRANRHAQRVDRVWIAFDVKAFRESGRELIVSRRKTGRVRLSLSLVLAPSSPSTSLVAWSFRLFDAHCGPASAFRSHVSTANVNFGG
jgi:hypothetical protein